MQGHGDSDGLVVIEQQWGKVFSRYEAVAAVGAHACLDRVPHLAKSIDVAPDGPVAHLAAAPGVETWVLVDRDGSWHWHGDPGPSPWYPNTRVFRQSPDGSWSAALAAIREALARTSA